MAAAVSSLSVRAAAGTGGVAYTWYLASELGPGEVWSGRAQLTAGSEGWQQVARHRRDLHLDPVRRRDGRRRWGTAGAATIAAFTAEHGDGPGYVLTGFGCDGRTFGVDAIRPGCRVVTTYDLEGWPVSTTIAANRRAGDPGQTVTLTGRSVDAANQSIGAALVLQARPRGAAGFRTRGRDRRGRCRRHRDRHGHARADDGVPLVLRRAPATPTSTSRR